MTVGQRIRFFRELRGMTQRELGEKAGFSAGTAGVRTAQYETGARTPKTALRKRFADALGVSPDALAIPGLDTPAGVMQTMFALEDLYGIAPEETGESLILRIPAVPSSGFARMRRALEAWALRREAMDHGLLTREGYDRWRYRFTNMTAVPDTRKGG